jgi:hypothetical protein
MGAMQKALEDWNDGKIDASEGFPSVSAVLSIQFASAGQQPKTLWKGPQKRLYFEIALAGDNIQRHPVIAPEEPK